MSGTKSNSSVEQSPDAVETESEEIETLSDDVNQAFMPGQMVKMSIAVINTSLYCRASPLK